MNISSKKALRAILLALSVAFIMMGCTSPDAPEQTTSQEITESTLGMDQLEYQGEIYQRRKNQTTILFLGLDKFEHTTKTMGYTNHMQSDFLVLAVLDRENDTCTLLHLNRDTMTPIRRLGIGGAAAGTFTGQLALAHTYGSGGSDSAINATRAVSTLLGGVKIDHYVTLTMEAVSVINDALGGVTITVLDDVEDAGLTKGETVTLMGEQSLLYVRSRSGVGDQSNLNRMERQRQYLYAFYEKLMEAAREDSGFMTKTMWKVSEDFTSDCSVNALDALWEEFSHAQLLPIRTIDGEAVKGEEFMEFYPNEESLQKTIIDLFYEKVG